MRKSKLGTRAIRHLIDHRSQQSTRSTALTQEALGPQFDADTEQDVLRKQSDHSVLTSLMQSDSVIFCYYILLSMLRICYG